MTTEIVNQQLDKPFSVSGLMNGQTIAQLQSPYLLSEADFVRLKGRARPTETVAVMIFSAIVGYAISLGPKLLDLLKNDNPLFSTPELKHIAGWCILSLLIYFLGYALPNDRASVMKKLSDHFNTAKPSTHIVEDHQ